MQLSKLMSSEIDENSFLGISNESADSNLKESLDQSDHSSNEKIKMDRKLNKLNTVEIQSQQSLGYTKQRINMDRLKKVASFQ